MDFDMVITREKPHRVASAWQRQLGEEPLFSSRQPASLGPNSSRRQSSQPLMGSVAASKTVAGRANLLQVEKHPGPLIPF
ncbi:hypothetical protein GJAV_G00030000 [Gymnothorax javanicus]|nr:hypothetical protein GJAV_G00030000 [Gymnothorax javanicus]